MAQPPYDPASVESIIAFAQRLSGKSLRTALEELNAEPNTSNKGDLGTLVQSLYFGLPADNKSEPDFAQVGVELKTTGVLESSDGGYRAKERLVLMMIDFHRIVDESWDSSSLLMKCRLILILFYLYEKQKPVWDLRFVLDPFLYQIPDGDLSIIRRDWEFIREKIANGRAHELSEGDTFYLGACRKGSGGPREKLRSQPNSDVGAKARAFSFKPSYMNQVIRGHLLDSAPLGVTEEVSFEDALAVRFAPYEGRSVEEISQAFGLVKKGKNHKGFHRQLANEILGNRGSGIEELNKAGIEMKTIRRRKSGSPRESMSFPGFRFLDIVKQEWEDSSFFEKLEKKFLFVVFREGEDGLERLERVAFWNMPYEDRVEAQRVWEDTKRRVAIDASDLPGLTESPVAHVRPKGRDGNDKIPTPQGAMALKQCFWLNAAYVRAQLERLSRAV